MSAYDNPTIIKDDSAMAWATGFAGIGQAFTESFNTARKEREAKEKEARLEAEKKEKDRKDLAISRQIFYSKNTAQISEDASKSRNDLEKKGVNQSISNQLLSFYEQSQTKIGENNADAAFSEIDKTRLTNDAQYASTANTLWANANTMLGGGGSQIKAIYDGEIGKLNADSIEYIGDDDITRLKNAIIPSKLGLDKNITSNLDYDINDLGKGMKVNIKADKITRAELETYISGVNPEIKRNGIDNFINSNKGTIEDNGDGTYNILSSEDVADRKSGEFYVVIPDPKKDKDLQTAGIYNDKDQLQDVFFEGPMYVNAQGNAGISKNEALVKVPKRLVKMEDINTLIKKQVETNIKGLLASDLQDMNKLRGFMRKTGSGGTGVEDAKNLVTKDLDIQVNTLSKPIIDSYKLDLMRNNNIRQDKDGNYYQLDEMALKEFDSKQKETKISARDQKNIDKAEDWDKLLTRIKDIDVGTRDDFEFGKKKVSYDGKRFRIETPGSNAGRTFDTKEQVVAYLRSGK